VVLPNVDEWFVYTSLNISRFAADIVDLLKSARNNLGAWDRGTLFEEPISFLFEAESAHVVNIVEPPKQVSILILRHFMETSAVEVLSEESRISDIKITMNVLLGWHQAVETVWEAFLWFLQLCRVLNIEDTLRALQGHHMWRKFDEFLKHVLIIVQLSDQGGWDIQNTTVPDAHVHDVLVSVRNFDLSF